MKSYLINDFVEGIGMNIRFVMILFLFAKMFLALEAMAKKRKPSSVDEIWKIIQQQQQITELQTKI